MRSLVRDFYQRRVNTAGYFGCFPAFFGFLSRIHNAAAIFQRAKSITSDNLKVNEYVLSLRPDNEAETFAGIEPFDDAFNVFQMF